MTKQRPLLRQLPLPYVTEMVEILPAELQVVVSLFPGIGLLDRGFEDTGFCVLRGPDLLWGGDVCKFNLPPGKINGVIGGPPCQDFSLLRRIPESGNGRLMLEEFSRVVLESQPDWWLMENVPGVPNVIIPGYSWQRLDLRASEFGLKQRRLRHIQFGSKHGMVLVMRRNVAVAVTHRAVTTRDRYGDMPWSKFLELQGLPSDFSLPGFTKAAARRAVGNGVPLPMATALAVAVRDMVPAGSVRICRCGCGRPLSGKKEYAKSGCRMRAMRRRNVPSDESTRCVT